VAERVAGPAVVLFDEFAGGGGGAGTGSRRRAGARDIADRAHRRVLALTSSGSCHRAKAAAFH
jgi:hypothetical protein